LNNKYLIIFFFFSIKSFNSLSLVSFIIFSPCCFILMFSSEIIFVVSFSSLSFLIFATSDSFSFSFSFFIFILLLVIVSVLFFEEIISWFSFVLLIFQRLKYFFKFLTRIILLSLKMISSLFFCSLKSNFFFSFFSSSFSFSEIIFFFFSFFKIIFFLYNICICIFFCFDFVKC